MKNLKILVFASSLFYVPLAYAETFVDQVDGGSALVCSNDSGAWVCKPVSIEVIRELGYTDVEGLILIEPIEEEESDNNDQNEENDGLQIELDSGDDLFNQGAEGVVPGC